MIVFPVESFTRATLRFVEFGFLGFIVNIWVQTPFFWKEPEMAGEVGRFVVRFGERRVAWLRVIWRVWRRRERVGEEVKVDGVSVDGVRRGWKRWGSGLERVKGRRRENILSLFPLLLLSKSLLVDGFVWDLSGIKLS